MNGNMKLLLGLGYVSGEYIDTALEAMPDRVRSTHRHRPIRALLIVAVIVSLLLALGAAAYAGNWFGIKDALLRQTEETVYLSIQGLESSAYYGLRVCFTCKIPTIRSRHRSASHIMANVQTK